MSKTFKVLGWFAVIVVTIGCLLTGVVFIALRQDC